MAYACITLDVKGVEIYWKRKTSQNFKLHPRKYIAASTVVSMRIPRNMLQALDDVAEKTGRTRNELISPALEFAVEHLDIP